MLGQLLWLSCLSFHPLIAPLAGTCYHCNSNRGEIQCYTNSASILGVTLMGKVGTSHLLSQLGYQAPSLLLFLVAAIFVGRRSQVRDWSEPDPT
jgi:hypothetical protein